MFNRTAELEEPKQDKQMAELLALQTRLEKVEQRFRNQREALMKIRGKTELNDEFISKAIVVLLKRVEEQIDQTETDDAKKCKRLKTNLEKHFAKKAKNKPKLTRTQALIKKAKEQTE